MRVKLSFDDRIELNELQKCFYMIKVSGVTTRLHPTGNSNPTNIATVNTNIESHLLCIRVVSCLICALASISGVERDCERFRGSYRAGL